MERIFRSFGRVPAVCFARFDFLDVFGIVASYSVIAVHGLGTNQSTTDIRIQRAHADLKHICRIFGGEIARLAHGCATPKVVLIVTQSERQANAVYREAPGCYTLAR